MYIFTCVKALSILYAYMLIGFQRVFFLPQFLIFFHISNFIIFKLSIQYKMIFIIFFGSKAF